MLLLCRRLVCGNLSAPKSGSCRRRSICICKCICIPFECENPAAVLLTFLSFPSSAVSSSRFLFISLCCLLPQLYYSFWLSCNCLLAVCFMLMRVRPTRRIRNVARTSGGDPGMGRRTEAGISMGHGFFLSRESMWLMRIEAVAHTVDQDY